MGEMADLHAWGDPYGYDDQDGWAPTPQTHFEPEGGLLADRDVWCCQCQTNVRAFHAPGTAVYPHRPDLAWVRVWRCPTCANYVGSYRDGEPLGTIPTPALRKLRQEVHRAVDMLWQGYPKRLRRAKRTRVYRCMSARLGWDFHAAILNTAHQAAEALRVARRLVVDSVFDEVEK